MPGSEKAVEPQKLVEEVKDIVKDGRAYLSCIVGVDKPKEGVIELIYVFHVYETGDEEKIRVRIPRDNPVVPSIIGVYKGAWQHEAEVADLLGVRFDGNPYAAPGFLKEVEGYPLRKEVGGEKQSA